MPQVQGTAIKISYKEPSNQDPIYESNHLAWLITNCNDTTDEEGKVQISEDENEKVLNLAKDVMGYLSNQPLPKHIGVHLQFLNKRGAKN